MMLEDFLNDNYLNLKELLRKHNLSTGCLAPIIRGEDDIKLLDNYVDPITKQQILLKYEQRRQTVEHQPFNINSKKDEDKVNVMKLIQEKYPDLEDKYFLMIDDTVSVLNYIMEHSAYSTVHISSFLK